MSEAAATRSVIRGGGGGGPDPPLPSQVAAVSGRCCELRPGCGLRKRLLPPPPPPLSAGPRRGSAEVRAALQLHARAQRDGQLHLRAAQPSRQHAGRPARRGTVRAAWREGGTPAAGEKWREGSREKRADTALPPLPPLKRRSGRGAPKALRATAEPVRSIILPAAEGPCAARCPPEARSQVGGGGSWGGGGGGSRHSASRTDVSGVAPEYSASPAETCWDRAAPARRLRARQRAAPRLGGAGLGWAIRASERVAHECCGLSTLWQRECGCGSHAESIPVVLKYTDVLLCVKLIYCHS